MFKQVIEHTDKGYLKSYFNSVPIQIRNNNKKRFTTMEFHLTAGPICSLTIDLWVIRLLIDIF